MQRAAGSAEGVDPLFHRWVVFQGRRMVALAAGIDHQRTAAAPVFAGGLRADAVAVGGRVGAGEGGPEKVVEVPRRPGAVVYHHDQRATVDALLRTEGGAEAFQGRIGLAPVGAVNRPFDNQHAGQGQLGVFEAVRQAQIAGQFGRQFPARRAGGGDDQFGAALEAAAGIVEGIDGGTGLEVQIPPPVDPFQQMPERGSIIGGGRWESNPPGKGCSPHRF